MRDGNAVRFAIRLDSHDIMFAAAFVPEGQSGELPILPPSRRKTCEVAFKAPASGLIRFTLDNGYSMLTAKKVHLSVSAGDEED